MSQWLSSIIDWFLGAESLSAGEGIQRSLKGTWYLAPWITVMLTVAIVAIVTYCYARERGTARGLARGTLVFLRLAAFALIAFMLAQYIITQSRTGLPYVIVMVDDSASMGIVDRYDDEKLREIVAAHLKAADLHGASRLEQAKSVLLADNAHLLRAIDSHYKLKVYLVSDTPRSLGGDVDDLVRELRKDAPEGQSTRLGQGVHTVLNELRGTPPTALVLLSDGINTEGESLYEAASYARRKGVPLFTVALGSQVPVRDLEINDLLVDEVVFVDDFVNFECKLTATGLAGRTVPVILREKDSPEILGSVDVTIAADGKPQKVRIPYRPSKVGQHEYVVEVRPLSEEVNADNNAQHRVVTVRKEKIRVLLVQMYPNFEFRYLKQMLRRDSTISLQTVLQEADLDYSETDETALRVFPVRRDELFEYDVI
ncbi:MAG TPA: vWA domain-containing protein, partial [Pirellulales bacterium]|nr:vWA domain-containing protein [Pirellulales bacterium]